MQSLIQTLAGDSSQRRSVVRWEGSLPLRRDAIFLSGILLWCLLLLGMQPVDDVVASHSVEHMWRCTIANGILLILILAISKTDLEVAGAAQSSIEESQPRRATIA